VYQRLLATVAQGKTRVGLLHSDYVYDFLLFTMALPFILTSAAVVSHRMAVMFSFRPSVYSLATFIFMLVVALMVFRLAFSFARWLVPYVEFAPQKQPLERRIRAFFAVITLGTRLDHALLARDIKMQRVSRLVRQHFKKGPLSTSIPLTVQMEIIEFNQELRRPMREFSPGQAA
jgi:hypothetical protein